MIHLLGDGLNTTPTCDFWLFILFHWIDWNRYGKIITDPRAATTWLFPRSNMVLDIYVLSQVGLDTVSKIGLQTASLHPRYPKTLPPKNGLASSILRPTPSSLHPFDLRSQTTGC